MLKRALTAAAALLLARPAFPAGFSFLDLGAERAGMMAVVAKADDPSAIFHNPAGLASQKGSAVSASVLGSIVHSRLRLRDENGSLSENIEPEKYYGFAPFVAATSDFGLERFTFGTAIYFPNFYAAALPKDAPTRYHIVDALFVTGYVTPTVAYQVSPKLSVGLGASLIYNRIEFSRAVSPATPDWDLKAEGDDWSFGWDLGLLYAPREDLRLGFSYTSQTDLAIEGALKVTTGSGQQILSTTHRTEMVIPAAYRAGVNYRGVRRLELGLDVSFWDYSVFREQRIDLAEGADIVTRKDYEDGWNFAVGAMLDLGRKVSLSAGIQRDLSPIPDRTYSLDNPNQSLWGFALGLFYERSDRTRLALSYLHNEYDGINIHHSETIPPTNGVGDGSNDELTMEVLYRF